MSAPSKRAPLLNHDRSRETAKIDHRCNSDGFWHYGYGNDPKRRRLIRHVEKQVLRKQIQEEMD